ncbi:MAG: hypothetical protein ACREOU_17120 [Candidatus Eiseniibacteriota bacterium]
MSRRLLTRVGIGAIGALLGSSEGWTDPAGECPIATLACNFRPEVRAEPVATINCDDFNVFGGAGYDLVHGQWHAEASGLYGLNVSVLTEDRFHLSAAAGSPTFPLIVRLYASGSATRSGVGGEGSALVRLSVPGHGSTERRTSIPYKESGNSFGEWLELSVMSAPDDSISVVVQLESSSIEHGSGYAFAILTFGGLPAGAFIRSCHGFELDGPTPTLPRSWGSLKAGYR